MSDANIGRQPNEFHTDYVLYKPIEDTVNYNPRRVFGKKGKKRPKVVKSKKKELITEFENTLSSLTNREIRDEDYAYFVLELLSSPVSFKYQRILGEMHIKLVAFLDKSQRRALVESRVNLSGERVIKGSRDIIKSVRPQSIEEKVEESLRLAPEKELVIVNTIPNVENQKIRSHLRKVWDYIMERRGEPLYTLIDEQNARGSIIAYANGPLIVSLASNSSIVFSAYKVPETILSSVKKAKRRKKQAEIALSSLEGTGTNSDYEIVEIDSGAKELQQFQGRVISAAGLDKFPNGDDKDNHGTPIASLLLYGEEVGKSPSTDFRVKSLKAFQEVRVPGINFEYADIHSAYMRAFDSHPRNKIFLSAANFTQHNEATAEETRKIDMLIHSKNVCLINSTGNISDAPKRLDRSERRKDIWDAHRVYHPSDATTITAVGAYSKSASFFDSSHRKYPACFSRFKSDFVSNKPEVLEFGGTHQSEGFASHSGVMTINVIGQLEERYGTSFAAPLFARHLASIHRALQGRINNSETIRAIAYSCTRFTDEHANYSGFGWPDFTELSTPQSNVARIIFEGEFAKMNSVTIPVHDIEFENPSQPVKIELYLVHSDNYRLQPRIPGNYTSIMVHGTKGQVTLHHSRKDSVTTTWTHAKKLVYKYQKNSVATWRFRLKPKLDNIPIDELPNLKIRYGGVIVIRATKPPKGFDSVKSAVKEGLRRMARASQAGGIDSLV